MASLAGNPAPRPSFRACNRAIILCGAARTGSTILGKILHSFEGVEYGYDSSMTISVISLIGAMTRERWMNLYETYFYEGFLFDSLAGRGLNCNRSDDSSIYRVKPRALVEGRLGKSLRRADLESAAENSTIAYKCMKAFPYLARLKRRYPGTRVLISRRDPEETIRSLVAKKWFSDDFQKTSQQLSLDRRFDGMLTPAWVPRGHERFWRGLDEVNRAAYYLVLVNRQLDRIPDAVAVEYRDLAESPEQTSRRLAERLGLRWGPMTAEIVASVKRPPLPPGSRLLERVDRGLRRELAGSLGPR